VNRKPVEQDGRQPAAAFVAVALRLRCERGPFGRLVAPAVAAVAAAEPPPAGDAAQVPPDVAAAARPPAFAAAALLRSDLHACGRGDDRRQGVLQVPGQCERLQAKVLLVSLGLLGVLCQLRLLVVDPAAHPSGAFAAAAAECPDDASGHHGAAPVWLRRLQHQVHDEGAEGQVLEE